MLSLLMNRPVVFHAHAASKSQRGSIQQVRDLFVPSSHSDPILTPGWIELTLLASEGHCIGLGTDILVSRNPIFWTRAAMVAWSGDF